MSQKRTYDSTVARIAGNILSGLRRNDFSAEWDQSEVEWAVMMARKVVAEVQRTEPKPEGSDVDG